MAFLVFEGLDGSGKSTLIEGLARELRQRGQNLVLSREPGGTPLAEEIRNLILRKGFEVPHARTELLLYAASRAQHVEQVIRPALHEQKWVLCDRFTASTIAFQCFARQLSRVECDWLNQFATAGLQADLTIYLDLTVAESMRRQKGRGTNADRMESEALDFHERVRQGYLAQAKQLSATWLVLDAMQTPEALLQNTLRVLTERGWLK